MITISFLKSNIFAPYDKELIAFLDNLLPGAISTKDKRILIGYYGLDWPDDRYCGYSVKNSGVKCSTK